MSKTRHKKDFRPLPIPCDFDTRRARKNWEGMAPWMDSVADGEDGSIQFGKLDADLDYGSSAVVSIWTGDPNSETDSTENETAYCWLLETGETIPSGTKVIIKKINGFWQVIAARCT